MLLKTQTLDIIKELDSYFDILSLSGIEHYDMYQHIKQVLFDFKVIINVCFDELTWKSLEIHVQNQTISDITSFQQVDAILNKLCENYWLLAAYQNELGLQNSKRVSQDSLEQLVLTIGTAIALLEA